MHTQLSSATHANVAHGHRRQQAPHLPAAQVARDNVALRNRVGRLLQKARLGSLGRVAAAEIAGRCGSLHGVWEGLVDEQGDKVVVDHEEIDSLRDREALARKELWRCRKGVKPQILVLVDAAVAGAQVGAVHAAIVAAPHLKGV